jgi:hypothetical protein
MPSQIAQVSSSNMGRHGALPSVATADPSTALLLRGVVYLLLLSILGFEGALQVEVGLALGFEALPLHVADDTLVHRLTNSKG